MSDAKAVAWILLAIAFWDKDQVSRSEVSHAADAISHATPTDDQIDAAVHFLALHGLIRADDQNYSLTSPGKSVVDTAHEGAANIFAEWKALEMVIDSMSRGDEA